MKNFWKYFSFILFGWIVGYFVKDNIAKQDEVINVDLQIKKNRFGNLGRKKRFANELDELAYNAGKASLPKRKIFNVFRKKENKV